MIDEYSSDEETKELDWIKSYKILEELFGESPSNADIDEVHQIEDEATERYVDYKLSLGDQDTERYVDYKPSLKDQDTERYVDYKLSLRDQDTERYVDYKPSLKDQDTERNVDYKLSLRDQDTERYVDYKLSLKDQDTERNVDFKLSLAETNAAIPREKEKETVFTKSPRSSIHEISKSNKQILFSHGIKGPFKYLGGGYFGDVFTGFFQDEPVAIKLLKPEHYNPNESWREAAVHRIPQHENIVHCIEILPENGAIMMEYINGNSLRSILSVDSYVINWTQILCIGYCIADAMRYVHNRCKIIHCDLTPNNIIYNKVTRNAMITDFGISHFEKNLEKLTNCYSTLKGKKNYIPPEGVLKEDHDKKQFSYAWDVYQFGTLLWEMLKSGDTLSSTLPIPPSCLPAYGELITWCRDNDPTKRPTFDVITSILGLLIKQYIPYEAYNNNNLSRTVLCMVTQQVQDTLSFLKIRECNICGVEIRNIQYLSCLLCPPIFICKTCHESLPANKKHKHNLTLLPDYTSSPKFNSILQTFVSTPPSINDDDKSSIISKSLKLFEALALRMPSLPQSVEAAIITRLESGQDTISSQKRYIKLMPSFLSKDVVPCLSRQLRDYYNSLKMYSLRALYKTISKPEELYVVIESLFDFKSSVREESSKILCFSFTKDEAGDIIRRIFETRRKKVDKVCETVNAILSKKPYHVKLALAEVVETFPQLVLPEIVAAVKQCADVPLSEFGSTVYKMDALCLLLSLHVDGAKEKIIDLLNYGNWEEKCETLENLALQYRGEWSDDIILAVLRCFGGEVNEQIIDVIGKIAEKNSVIFTKFTEFCFGHTFLPFSGVSQCICAYVGTFGGVKDPERAYIWLSTAMDVALQNSDDKGLQYSVFAMVALAKKAKQYITKAVSIMIEFLKKMEENTLVIKLSMEVVLSILPILPPEEKQRLAGVLMNYYSSRSGRLMASTLSKIKI